MTADMIADYRRRGWSLVPIPAGQKGPTATGWQNRRWEPAAFPPAANFGLILGPQSGETVDADLDCPEALALADLYLSPTGAEFGRASKPRSHRLYIAPGAAFEAFVDPTLGDTLLELRARGAMGGEHQTLIPPSVADGERREWYGSTIAPAVITSARLRAACAWLAVACLIRRYVSESASERPGPDMPRLLFEADPVLGRKAFEWLGWPDPTAPRRHPKPRAELTAGEIELRELAAEIPNPNLGWDEWNAFGLAFYAATDGSEEAFIAIDDFSARSTKYDPHETAARWKHYARSRPSKTGIGKLIAAALKAGWRPEPKRGRTDGSP